MKIFLGSDHRGFHLKEKIKKYLAKLGVEFEDLGNKKFDPYDDYPDFAFLVAKKVAEGKGMGILICGSGEGMAITANKVKNIRAAVAFSPKQIKLLREKNDINILALSSDWTKEGVVKKIVKTFLETKFKKIKRHQRRIDKIKKIEKTENLDFIR
jgi:ribose 5-phosphate isomerase B